MRERGVVTKDKYGFYEETFEPKERVDNIGKALGIKGYIQNFQIGGMVFSRYYWQKKLLIDQFKQEAEAEIQFKQGWAKKNKYIYVPVRAGERLTLEELEEALRR